MLSIPGKDYEKSQQVTFRTDIRRGAEFVKDYNRIPPDTALHTFKSTGCVSNMACNDTHTQIGKVKNETA